MPSFKYVRKSHLQAHSASHALERAGLYAGWLLINVPACLEQNNNGCPLSVLKYFRVASLFILFHIKWHLNSC